MNHRLPLPEEAFLLVKGLDCTGQPLAPCNVIACLNSITLQSDALLATVGDMRLKAKFEAAEPVLICLREECVTRRLLHHIREKCPILYNWFEHHAKTYLRADSERRYGRRLAAAGADPAGIDVREEILADFIGDALADPVFSKRVVRNRTKRYR